MLQAIETNAKRMRKLQLDAPIAEVRQKAQPGRKRLLAKIGKTLDDNERIARRIWHWISRTF